MEELFLFPVCGLLLIFGAFVVGMFGFWIWMLIDCATREAEGTNKITWILILIFVQPPILGAVIYLLARKLPRDKRKAPGS